VFRELTGRTLTQYLHDLRLRAAVDHLGEASLARLAADLGYCSASHFSDRFRDAFGMTPSQCAISWKRTPPAAHRTAACSSTRRP